MQYLVGFYFIVLAVIFPIIAIGTTQVAAASKAAATSNDVKNHRQAEMPVLLKAGQRLLLTNGDYVVRQTNGTLGIVSMNGRVVRTFPRSKLVKAKSGNISIISGNQRVKAGTFKAIRTHAVPKGRAASNDLKGHRQTEMPVLLKVGQRLLLTNGAYVARQANGTLSILEMNGRVVRTFPRSKLVKAKSGDISIISGNQRVKAGTFKSIMAGTRVK